MMMMNNGDVNLLQQAKTLEGDVPALHAWLGGLTDDEKEQLRAQTTACIEHLQKFADAIAQFARVLLEALQPVLAECAKVVMAQIERNHRAWKRFLARYPAATDGKSANLFARSRRSSIVLRACLR